MLIFVNDEARTLNMNNGRYNTDTPLHFNKSTQDCGGGRPSDMIRNINTVRTNALPIRLEQKKSKLCN